LWMPNASATMLSIVLALLTNLLVVDAAAGNSDVIVLVHGFLGFGPDEMLGFKYWGGINNIAKELQGAGHDVRVGVVGPVSSNWDRAAELFAYIKGGKVDYGAVHAAKFNHSRFGRTFPGIYPEWGTVGPDGFARRIHLIGHSMGGQTIRMLLRFLADGDAIERQQKGSSSLFDGGRVSWVNSISTVNTPHDGTTLCGKALGEPFLNVVVWPLLKGICAINGLWSDNLVYDFKLDQFGLERRSGEGFFAYSERIKAASVWDESFKDFSQYDLSVAGAREMNAITPAQESVYYFSYASVDTEKGFLSKCQVPKLLMWAFLQPLAYLAGCSGDDEAWWANDGVVNTVSENGPKLGSTDVIVAAGATVRSGIWNYMGVRTGVDHLENVGMGVQPVEDYYKAMAATVAALPPRSSNTVIL